MIESLHQDSEPSHNFRFATSRRLSKTSMDRSNEMSQRRRERRTAHDTAVKERAAALANLLIVFRSAAYMYPTRRSRRARVLKWLYDVRFFRTARDFTPRLEVPRRACSAVVDFCLGHVGARELGDRLFAAFRDTADARKFLRGRRLLDNINTTAAAVSTAGMSSSADNVTAGVSDASVGGSIGLHRYGTFWYALYDRLRALTVAGGSGADDRYDARIEFMRDVKFDTAYGVHVLMGGMSQTPDAGGFVEYDEFYTILATVGHARRAINVANFGQPAGSDVELPVYLFGSNCFWIESDALYTLSPSSRRPAAFEDGQQIVTFCQHLMSIADTELVPDVLQCRNAAVARNRPILTAVSRNEISLQVSFAMPDSHLYTADLFYMSGGNTCATYLRYRRRYLSNACKCENRLSYWRLCVSVTTFDGARIISSIGRDGVSRFVTDVVRAFYHSKSGEQGAHFYINAFTGLALVDYINDSTELGGMAEGKNIASSDDSTPALVCHTHSWLRSHLNDCYWRPVTACHAVQLLNETPQLLVVYRPLISESATAADGPNVFLKYKTFDDVLVKYVLLSLATLRDGYANRPKGVAYKARDCFWLFSDTETIVQDEGEGVPSWLREVKEYGGPPLFDLRRDVDGLYGRVFSAPSRLYVHANVLTELGFNVAAVTEAIPARTFTHIVEPDVTANGCTVFSSSPLVVIDEKTGSPLKSRHAVETLRVLTQSAESTKAASEDRIGTPVVTVTTSLDEFWPGVIAVKTSLGQVSTVLENVEFVYFTAPDGDAAVRRLTDDGLARLNRAITGDRRLEPISPPVLFALHRSFVRLDAETKARHDPPSVG